MRKKGWLCGLLFAIILVSSTVAFCFDGDGFAGYAWGTTAEEIPGLRSLPDGGRYSVFEGELDVAYLIGDIEANKIRAVFSGSKGLSAGIIDVISAKKAVTVLEYMKATHGSPQVDSVMRTYKWTVGNRTAVCFYFTSQSQRDRNFPSALINVYDTSVHRQPLLPIVK